MAEDASRCRMRRARRSAGADRRSRDMQGRPRRTPVASGQPSASRGGGTGRAPASGDSGRRRWRDRPRHHLRPPRRPRREHAVVEHEIHARARHEDGEARQERPSVRRRGAWCHRPTDDAAGRRRRRRESWCMRSSASGGRSAYRQTRSRRSRWPAGTRTPACRSNPSQRAWQVAGVGGWPGARRPETRRASARRSSRHEPLDGGAAHPASTGARHPDRWRRPRRGRARDERPHARHDGRQDLGDVGRRWHGRRVKAKRPPAVRANTPSSTSACTWTFRFTEPPKR